MIRKITTLTVHNAEERVLLRLECRDEHCRVLSVAPSIEASVRKWLDRGLLEWLGPPEDRTPRVTPSSSGHFLPRLRGYLESQFPSLRISAASRYIAEPDLNIRFEAMVVGRAGRATAAVANTRRVA